MGEGMKGVEEDGWNLDGLVGMASCLSFSDGNLLHANKRDLVCHV